MAEVKATQCPMCKKGKRESDKYCSERCVLEAAKPAMQRLLEKFSDESPECPCPSIDGSNEIDPLDMAAQAEEMRDRARIEETEAKITNETKLCMRCKRPLKSPGKNETYSALCEGCLE